MIRMKAYRKAQMYSEAYRDAKNVWQLMDAYERAKNFSFKKQYINELAILVKAFDQKKKKATDGGLARCNLSNTLSVKLNPPSFVAQNNKNNVE